MNVWRTFGLIIQVSKISFLMKKSISPQITQIKKYEKNRLKFTQRKLNKIM